MCFFEIILVTAPLSFSVYRRLGIAPTTSSSFYYIRPFQHARTHHPPLLLPDRSIDRLTLESRRFSTHHRYQPSPADKQAAHGCVTGLLLLLKRVCKVSIFFVNPRIYIPVNHAKLITGKRYKTINNNSHRAVY